MTVNSDKITEPVCMVGEGGVFVGLVSRTMSILGEEKSTLAHDHRLYHSQIERLFSNYKRGLQKHCTNTREWWYKPQPYSILGRWDLAVLSLIDDIEFPTKVFRPFDTMVSDETDVSTHRPFHHQVLMGPVPVNSNTTAEDAFAETFQDSPEHPRPPLIAICQLKVNPFLIGAGGIQFLRLIVKGLTKLIEHEFQSKENEDARLRIRSLALQSYSWNELTWILLGDSFQRLTALVVQAREHSLGNLETLLKMDNDADPDATHLRTLFGQPCLSKDILSIEPNTPLDQIRGCHIFVNSTTLLGYDYGLEDEIANKCIPNDLSTLLSRLAAHDCVSAETQWTVRPGHIREACGVLNRLGDIPGSSRIVSVGRSDLVELFPTPIPTSALIERIIRIRAENQLGQHFLSSSTIVGLSEQYLLDLSHEVEHDTHAAMGRTLSGMVISAAEIGEFYDLCRALGVPKITSQRFLNIISNCNEGIADQLSCVYFLELIPAIRSFYVRVRQSLGEQQRNRHDTVQAIEEAAKHFELGHRCRFRSGYRLADVTDFGTQIKGGLQLTIAAIDGAFKCLVAPWTHQQVFLALGSEPDIIVSDDMALLLDPTCLLRPENLACTLTHEAAHCFYSMVVTEPRSAGTERLQDVEAVSKRWSTDCPLGGRMRSRQAFEEYFGDILSFWWTFNGDAYLFQRSYWAQFVRLPRAWQRNLATDSDRPMFERRSSSTIIGFATRIFAVLKAAGRLETDLWIPSECSISKDICDEALRVVNECSAQVFEYLRAVSKWAIAELRRMRSFSSQVPQLEMQNVLKAQLESDVSMLKRGCVIEFRHNPDHSGEVDVDSGWSDLQAAGFVQRVLGAYLAAVDGIMEQRVKTLPRNSDGHAIVGPGDPNVMPDAQGGSFVWGEEARQTYWRLRSALILSLWDLSAKRVRHVALCAFPDIFFEQ